MLDYLKVDPEPKFIQIVSEPYVIFHSRRYQPVVDIVERKSKRKLVLFIRPVTLSMQLNNLQQENNGQIIGLEFWIRKESYEKKSKYVLEQ